MDDSLTTPGMDAWDNAGSGLQDVIRCFLLENGYTPVAGVFWAKDGRTYSVTVDEVKIEYARFSSGLMPVCYPVKDKGATDG